MAGAAASGKRAPKRCAIVSSAGTAWSARKDPAANQICDLRFRIHRAAAENSAGAKINGTASASYAGGGRICIAGHRITGAKAAAYHSAATICAISCMDILI